MNIYLNKVVIQSKTLSGYKKDFCPELINLHMAEKIILDIFKYSKTKIPTIYWKHDFFELQELYIYKYIIKIQNKYFNKDFINVIESDSIPLNKKFIDFIKKNNFSINLTLNTSNLNNFKRSIKSLFFLKKNDVDVNIKIPVSKKLIKYIDKIYNLLNKYNISYVDFVPSKQEPKEKIYCYFLCRIFDLWCKELKYIKSKTSIKIFDTILYNRIYENKKINIFQIDSEIKINFHSNGDIYFSQNTDNGKFKLGNIKNYNTLLMLNSKKYFDLAKEKNKLSKSKEKYNKIFFKHSNKGFNNIVNSLQAKMKEEQTL